jgi:hypothetical protein
MPALRSSPGKECTGLSRLGLKEQKQTKKNKESVAFHLCEFMVKLTGLFITRFSLCP